MSKKAYEENDIQNIANAIREKNGSTDTYKVSEMPIAIRNIEGGGSGKYAPRHISFTNYTGNELDKELENLDTSNVTNMRSMFSNCRNLISLNLSNFNTSNVTDIGYMFSNCGNLTSLDLSNFNTSNVTDIGYMFSNCRNLISLNLSNFNTSNVTDIGYMFSNCGNLTSLDLSNFDTSNVTNIGYMFNYSNKLTSLDLSNFDTSKVTSISSMFIGCSKLTNLTFCNNLGKGYTQKRSNYSNYTLTLSSSNLLTHDSLMDVINKLYDLNLTYDVANGGTLYTQKLVLGSTNIAKLTAEEIAIATNKGWTVS